MPRKRNSWRNLANQTSLLLSLIAGFTINLLTDGFKQTILSHPLFMICLLMVLAYIGYQVIKMRSVLLITTFVILVLSVFFNLFSSWFEDTILHKSFTTVNISVFLVITIILLVLGGFIATHPIDQGKKKLRYLYKTNARNNGKAMRQAFGLNVEDHRQRRNTSQKKKKLPKLK